MKAIIFLTFSFLFFHPLFCQTTAMNFQYYPPNSSLRIQFSQFPHQSKFSIINYRDKDKINNENENISKKRTDNFYVELGYLISIYNINSQKDHFGTNVPFEKFSSGKSKNTFSVGFYLEIEKNTNIKYLFGFNTYFGNHQIIFKYKYTSGYSDFTDKIYIHKINSVCPFNPFVGINIYNNIKNSNTFSNTFNLFATARLGLKLINNIDSEKISVDPEDEKEYVDHDAARITDDNLLYFTLGLGFIINNFSFNITYSPNLYSFKYTQGEIYYIQGEIFNAKVSVAQIGISYKL